ncbi:MAG: hypothetical protein Q9183_005091 [Haloplaca sp. 2 TL-2023]
MEKGLEWDRLPGWNRLDFGVLGWFIFNPYLQTLDQSSETGDEYAPMSRNACAAIDMVLKKGRKSLRVFAYGPNCPMLWPGPEVISLPKLRHIDICSGSLQPTHLKDWCARMPALKKVTLISVGQGEEDSVTGWQRVLDAIRHHKNDMQIHFTRLELESKLSDSYSSHEGVLDFHTSNPSEYLKKKVEPGSWPEFERSLALYLSGKGDFDQVLIDGFTRDE